VWADTGIFKKLNTDDVSCALIEDIARKGRRKSSRLRPFLIIYQNLTPKLLQFSNIRVTFAVRKEQWTQK
jgi:hypothetical protein